MGAARCRPHMSAEAAVTALLPWPVVPLLDFVDGFYGRARSHVEFGCLAVDRLEHDVVERLVRVDFPEFRYPLVEFEEHFALGGSHRAQYVPSLGDGVDDHAGPFF